MMFSALSKFLRKSAKSVSPYGFSDFSWPSKLGGIGAL